MHNAPCCWEGKVGSSCTYRRKPQRKQKHNRIASYVQTFTGPRVVADANNKLGNRLKYKKKRKTGNEKSTPSCCSAPAPVSYWLFSWCCSRWQLGNVRSFTVASGDGIQLRLTVDIISRSIILYINPILKVPRPVHIQFHLARLWKATCLFLKKKSNLLLVTRPSFLNF